MRNPVYFPLNTYCYNLTWCGLAAYTRIVWSKSNAFCCLELRLVIIVKVADVSLLPEQRQVARIIAPR